MKRTHEAVRSFSSDQRFTIEDIIAADDKVWAWVVWRGTNDGDVRLPFGTFGATGKSFAVEQVHISRLEDGKIAEHWAVTDDLGWFRQVGILPESE